MFHTVCDILCVYCINMQTLFVFGILHGLTINYEKTLNEVQKCYLKISHAAVHALKNCINLTLSVLIWSRNKYSETKSPWLYFCCWYIVWVPQLLFIQTLRKSHVEWVKCVIAVQGYPKISKSIKNTHMQLLWIVISSRPNLVPTSNHFGNTVT